MTSFSCSESSSSSSLIRLLIINSVSFDTVIWPVMTSRTRSLSQSFPLVRSSGLCPTRPSSAMRSRRLRLSTAGSAAVCAAATGFSSAPILALLLLVRLNADLRAGLVQHFLVLDHLLQQTLQLFIADQTATQVGEAIAQFQQLTKRSNLLCHLRRLEIVHTFEA